MMYNVRTSTEAGECSSRASLWPFAGKPQCPIEIGSGRSLLFKVGDHVTSDLIHAGQPYSSVVPSLSGTAYTSFPGQLAQLFHH
jgi:hypothetical protein